MIPNGTGEVGLEPQYCCRIVGRVLVERILNRVSFFEEGEVRGRGEGDKQFR